MQNSRVYTEKPLDRDPNRLGFVWFCVFVCFFLLNGLRLHLSMNIFCWRKHLESTWGGQLPPIPVCGHLHHTVGRLCPGTKVSLPMVSYRLSFSINSSKLPSNSSSPRTPAQQWSPNIPLHYKGKTFLGRYLLVQW